MKTDRGTRTTLLVSTIALLIALLVFSAITLLPPPATAALNAAPIITNVSPTTGSNDRSTRIVVNGANLMPTPAVRLDDTPLVMVQWYNPGQLVATVPWGLTPGAHSLIVTNPDGQSATRPNAFTVSGALAWTTGGPYGGEVVELVRHPVTPTQLYVLAQNTGLFASADAGTHWSSMRFDSWPKHLAIDPHTPGDLYLGSDFGFVRTADGGATWSSIALPNLQPNSPVYPLTHPITAGVVYAAVSAEINRNIQPGEAAGVFRSNDHGATWIAKSAGITDTQVTVLAFKPDDANVLLAGTRTGNIFVSTDGGESWQWAAKPTDYIGKLYFNPFNPTEVWAVRVGTGLPSITPNLFKSTFPALNTWTTINVIQNGPPYWVNALAFDVAGTVRAGLGNAPAGVYKTSDGGQTWNPVTAAPLETTSLLPASGSSQSIGTRCGKFGEHLNNPMVVCGVYQSGDSGASWQAMNQGLAGLSTEALAVSPASRDRVYTYNERGLLKSTNGGNTWQELGIFKYGFPWDGSRLAVDPFTPSRLYLGSSSDNIAPGATTSPVVRIGNDDGQGWQTITLAKPPVQNAWSGDVFAVAADPTRPGRILAGLTFFPPDYNWSQPSRPLGAIYVSDNYGMAWRQTVVTQPISGVVQIAFDSQNRSLVYAATGGPGNAAGTGLLRSVDGGEHWQRVNACPTVNSIAVHPWQVNSVTIACTTGTYRSSDAGSTWSPLPNSLPILLYAPTSPPVLYAGSRWGSNGLNRSVDDGRTWQSVPSLPINAAVFALAAGRDATSVALYVSITGGMQATAGDKANRASAFSRAEGPVGGGIFRLVVPQDTYLYLPLIVR